MKQTKQRIYLLSAIIPLLIMMVIFIIMGMYPFGSTTPMAIDFASQYIDLFAYLKHAILTLDFNSFFYSFSKSLGGDMVGLWGYYLLSPFNLFYVILPFEELRIAASLTILFRYAAMGFAFSYLLVKRYNGAKKRPFLVPIFSTLYALSGFAVSYQMNPLWYDALWMLPLVIVGVEEVMDNNSKAYKYSLLLAAMIIMQYYMAYMMCLFIVLYSFIYACRIYSGQTVKEKCRRFITPLLRLAWYSILAVGISAILLYPIVQNLLITKGSYTTIVPFKWELEFNPIDIVSKLFVGAFDYDQMPHGLPNIYIGALAFIGLILFFMTKTIRKSERIMSAVVLGVFVLSMVHDYINKIWHLMQTPAWFYHRFTYLTCFLLVLLAYRAIQKVEMVSLKQYGVIASLIFGCHMAVVFFPQSFMTWEKQMLSTLFWLAVFIVLQMKRHKWTVLALAVLTIAELGINAYLVQSSISYANAIAFQNAQTVQKPVIDSIRPNSTQFYRIAKTYSRTKNDPFMYNYPGLTNFSSTMEASTLDLFDNMGDAGSNAATNYGSGTPLTDALYGVRYFVQMRNLDNSVKNNPNIYSFIRETTRKDLYHYYKAVFETDRLRVYENKDVLPIAFGASEQLVHLTLKENQPAQNQNAILQAMRPLESRDYFEQYAFNDIVLDNFETDNPDSLSSVSLKRIDENKQAKISYSFIPQTSESYYISVPSTLNISKSDIKLTLNGETFEYYRTFDHRQLWNVAFDSAHEKVTFEVSTTQLNQLNIFNMQLWKLNKDVVKDAIQSRMAQGMVVSYWNNNTIEGTVNITDNSPFLMTTIPYSPGWSVYVDGINTPLTKVWNSLMAVPITSGEHTIKFVYTPVGMFIGFVVSIVSIVLLGSSAWFGRKKDDKII